jgi:hypothetical protein
MSIKYIKNIDKLYQGCILTPSLWIGHSIFNLQQINLSHRAYTIDFSTEKTLRLGKLVERFISHQLQQQDSIKLLAENVQIQHQKITLGELDCILKQNDTPIHLEVIYKFYLYDNTVGTTELEHWIGPNRNDSFVKKLKKLKEKQLPLLYNEHTETLLETLELDIKIIKQQVCFKAQLFVPLSMRDQQFESINNACITGFYIYKNELEIFSDYKFFIPEKLEWLLEVHTKVTWRSYTTILETLNDFLNNKMSPMVWIKIPNGTIQKFFGVWW